MSTTEIVLSKRNLSPDYDINETVCEIIKAKNSLTKIIFHYFNEQEIEIFLATLYNCLNLEEIDLSKNMTEDKQAPQLVQLINHLPRLRKLDVSHSFMSERGIILLIEACLLKKIQLNISFSRMSHEKTRIYQKKLSMPIDAYNPSLNNQVISSIPNYQQNYDYDCGAFVMLNIIEYYNKLLKKEAIIPNPNEMLKLLNTCNKTGTDIENMILWFKNNNYEVQGGFGGTEKLLRHYTGLGIPVIVNTNEWGGHYLVVICFETFDPIWPEKDKIWCCDPLDYQNGDYNPEEPYRKINLLRFLHEWIDSKGRKGGYIAAFPHEISDRNLL